MPGWKISAVALPDLSYGLLCLGSSRDFQRCKFGTYFRKTATELQLFYMYRGVLYLSGLLTNVVYNKCVHSRFCYFTLFSIFRDLE